MPGELKLSEPHERWLADNNAALTVDQDALHERADQLGAKIAENPDVVVYGIELPQDEKTIAVQWQPPYRQSMHLPYDQRELNQAVDFSLARLRHRAQQLFWYRVGIPLILSGAGAAFVGYKFVENKWAEYGGWVVAGLGAVALMVANGRRLRQPEPAKEALSPLRLAKLPPDSESPVQ